MSAGTIVALACVAVVMVLVGIMFFVWLPRYVLESNSEAIAEAEAADEHAGEVLEELNTQAEERVIEVAAENEAAIEKAREAASERPEDLRYGPIDLPTSPFDEDLGL